MFCFFFNERIYTEQLTIFPKHLSEHCFDQTEEIRTCIVKTLTSNDSPQNIIFFSNERIYTEHLTISPKILFDNFFDQTEEIRTCMQNT